MKSKWYSEWNRYLESIVELSLRNEDGNSMIYTAGTIAGSGK